MTFIIRGISTVMIVSGQTNASVADHMAISSTFVASDGDGYEVQMGRWSRRLAPLFIDFAGIAAAERVLDVGCGTGNLSFSIARNPAIGSVRGIDFSAAYVDHAKRRNRDARVDFEVGDACALPFPDASFDHTLSLLVLQFIPQADLAVREMRRVTRPGGIVAAATWDTRGGLVCVRLIFDTAAMLDEHGNEDRARAYTKPMSRPGDLARAWREAGLVGVVDGMLTIRMDFVSFADFWVPAEGKDGPIAAYVGTLGMQAREKLRDMVKLAYLDGEVDGPRSYAATAWVVKGKVP
ncbi:MAG: class I SAM-dependent methyltransferase [Candidatus Accumulibacter meliphilus]|jgi:SAM-dependent methyltransferase|uniref:class I SAM-dependent methyltransferase n=1 Tax=Candidatus Accumulibacter meliphilus TaxID=2211374 RepID=UPI002FC3AEFA